MAMLLLTSAAGLRWNRRASSPLRVHLPGRCPASRLERLEVAAAFPAGDPLADSRAYHVGGAPVDPAPHARVDGLLERPREAGEAPGRARTGAECAERHPVRAEEALQSTDERAATSRVSGGIL